VAVVDVPMPAYGDYECLVRITACGLCSGTDLKLIDNAIADLKIQYPTVLGHEAVGVIVAAGEKVRSFRVGDRVVSPAGRVMPGCGFHSNWAHMAEYGVAIDLPAMAEDGLSAARGADLDNFATRRIPDAISDIDAVMLLTFKENYSALRNFGLRPGMDLLIYGDGAVALGLAIMAREMGAGRVGCVGHHDERLARIADRTPLDFAINARRERVPDAVGGARFDIVIDGVGSVDVVYEGARLLKPGGRVGLYGVLKRAKADVNLIDLPNNALLQTLNWPYREHASHDAVVELVLRGALNPKDFYSHVMPLDQAPAAVELIRSRRAYKVIFDLSMSGGAQ
ncbi:MAG: alcohol dehydrogenase catalytic domain-containing protein, partial [Clostridiales bacterium]|nr:alcohol dehydrogenase catalytic domain-containing protein [Clostridiales bacterium]